MLERDILETFKKHIGEVESSERVSKLGIHKFSEDMKGANEFIGALQILDIALNKICKQCKIDMEQDNLSNQTYIHNIIESCSFMGAKLFDITLSTRLNGDMYEFCVENPLLLLESNGIQGVYNYADDKRSEIKFMLISLSNAISSSNVSKTNYDFDTYGASDFKHLFR